MVLGIGLGAGFKAAESAKDAKIYGILFGIVGRCVERYELSECFESIITQILIVSIFTMGDCLGNIIGGTSFAAPRLSFLAAQYLLSGGTVSCSGVVDTVEPPLNTSDLAGPWPNLPLADASNGYCSTFPPWPP